MPQLLIRGLSNELVSQVRAYARATAQRMPDAAASLLRRGLADYAARAAGGKARWADKTDAERTAHAALMVAARKGEP